MKLDFLFNVSFCHVYNVLLDVVFLESEVNGFAWLFPIFIMTLENALHSSHHESERSMTSRIHFKWVYTWVF